MNEQYEHPPIIELIVELRWQPLPPTTASATPPVPPLSPAILVNVGDTVGQEEFFINFTSRISQLHTGTNFQIERMIPSSFPVLPFQPVYRFRNVTDRQWTRLYQVGAGVFSAHALPPNYRSWSEFQPFVKMGVQALVASRCANERTQGFFSVILRYLDAFGRDLTGEVARKKFCETVLGFHVQIPEMLEQLAQDISQVVPTVQLSIPLKSGGTLNTTVMEAPTKDGPKVLMDTMVISNVSVVKENDDEATILAIMDNLNQSHSLTDSVFRQTTQSIQARMHPVRGGNE